MEGAKDQIAGTPPPQNWYACYLNRKKIMSGPIAQYLRYHPEQTFIIHFNNYCVATSTGIFLSPNPSNPGIMFVKIVSTSGHSLSNYLLIQESWFVNITYDIPNSVSINPMRKS
jgi:hypothetical protein